MQVRVLFFGVLKDLLSSSGEAVMLPEGATVAQLMEQLRNGNGIDHRAESAGHPVWSALAVAVNREYAASGGASERMAPVVGLVRKPIDRDALVASLKQPGDGAVVVFDGIVRDHTRGRKTLYLDYEAYEEMALAEMQKLAVESQGRFAIDRVGVVHRLGRLEIGESSIVIVVTSAHRAAAFDACRWLIDTLKRTVPVWKKEHFADGAVWKDGEPFPAELQPGSSS
jgi:molybdopterin synthase catalytic subunit